MLHTTTTPANDLVRDVVRLPTGKAWHAVIEFNGKRETACGRDIRGAQPSFDGRFDCADCRRWLR